MTTNEARAKGQIPTWNEWIESVRRRERERKERDERIGYRRPIYCNCPEARR